MPTWGRDMTSGLSPPGWARLMFTYSYGGRVWCERRQKVLSANARKILPDSLGSCCLLLRRRATRTFVSRLRQRHRGVRFAAEFLLMLNSRRPCRDIAVSSSMPANHCIIEHKDRSGRWRSTVQLLSSFECLAETIHIVISINSITPCHNFVVPGQTPTLRYTNSKIAFALWGWPRYTSSRSSNVSVIHAPYSTKVSLRLIKPLTRSLGAK